MPKNTPRGDDEPDIGLIISCERNFHTFVQEAWPTTVMGDAFIDNWHIGAICDHLTALYDLEIRKLLINMPPRFGKSVIASVGTRPEDANAVHVICRAAEHARQHGDPAIDHEPLVSRAVG